MRNITKTYEWIGIEKLHSGLSYQRPIDENFVNDKVKNFDKNEVEPPCISLRVNENGEKEYRVIDGQHTIAIVKCIGWTRIKCEVRAGLTDEEEHEWFYIKNTKHRDQNSNRLLNSKCRGRFDENINNLVKSLSAVGYKLKTVDVKSGNGVIYAGVCVENIFKTMDSKDFIDLMALHSAIWGGDKKSMQASFLRGIKKFYCTYKHEIDNKRFVKAFINKNISANDIIKEANSDIYTKDISIKYAKVICKYYNKGLKDDKKLRISKLDD